MYSSGWKNSIVIKKSQWRQDIEKKSQGRGLKDYEKAEERNSHFKKILITSYGKVQSCIDTTQTARKLKSELVKGLKWIIDQ